MRYLTLPLILILLIGNLAATPAPAQARTTLPWGDKSSAFGAVVSLGNRVREDEMPIMIDLMKEAGVQWNREEISWHHIQSAPGGPFRWDGDEAGFYNYDRSITLQHEAGIEMLGLLAYNPAWFKGQYPKLEEWLPDWSEYVYATVKRYGDKIKYWEIWNEPNLAIAGYDSGLYTTGHYVEVLKASQEAAQRADPEARIVLGALCDIWSDLPPNFHDTPEYLRELAELGAWKYFDVLAVHPYRPGPPEIPTLRRDRYETLKDTMDDIDAILEQWGPKPIWYTEMGWSREFFGIKDDAEQAAWMERFFLLVLTRPGVEKVFWYDFRDDVDHPGLYTEPVGNSSSNREHHFGLLRRTYPLRFDDPNLRKPGYHTFIFLNQTLSSLSWQGTLADPYATENLGWQRWGDDQRTMDVIWWTQPDQEPQTVTVRCNCPQVTIRAYDGSVERVVDTVGGAVEVQPPAKGTPIWVEWGARSTAHGHLRQPTVKIIRAE
jgi:hypothetical protein